MWWWFTVALAQELTGDEWDRTRPSTLAEADTVAVGMTVNQQTTAAARGREVAELLPLAGFRQGAVSGEEQVARLVRVCNALARGLNATTSDAVVRREAEARGVDAAARRELAATHAALRALVPADQRSDLTALQPL
jgi:hypothetical protein